MNEEYIFYFFLMRDYIYYQCHCLFSFFQGGYNDYLELLKLYDKNSNGTMMLAELDNILCNLGDEVPKEDVQKHFAELCDPEDEDGMFPYMSFLDRLTGKA